MEKIKIPEEVIIICRSLAKAARESGLNQFSARFSPKYDSNWQGDVSMAWEQGRHGEDANKFSIMISSSIHAKINE